LCKIGRKKERPSLDIWVTYAFKGGRVTCGQILGAGPKEGGTEAKGGGGFQTGTSFFKKKRKKEGHWHRLLAPM